MSHSPSYKLLGHFPTGKQNAPKENVGKRGDIYFFSVVGGIDFFIFFRETVINH